MNNNTLKKLYLFCFLAFGISLLLLACTPINNGEKDKYKIILIAKTIDSDNGFWTSLISGAELGAEEFGAEIEVYGGKTEEDIEGQIKTIEKSIEKKPDILLVTPGSYSETTESLKKVVDSGIPLVLIDSVIDEDIAKATVSTDNYLAGKELGEYARTLLGEGAQIGIIGHVKGTSTAIEREEGIKDGLGEYKDKIVDIQYCGSDFHKAYALTKNMLEEFPELDMIIGTNEYSAVGAARAVKDAGLAKKVKMVGFDNSVEEIQLLEQGVFQGIVIQKPFNMGYLGVELAINILNGKDVNSNLDSGCKLITKDNLYEEENQKLLYPFNEKQ